MWCSSPLFFGVVFQKVAIDCMENVYVPEDRQGGFLLKIDLFGEMCSWHWTASEKTTQHILASASSGDRLRI